MILIRGKAQEKQENNQIIGLIQHGYAETNWTPSPAITRILTLRQAAS